MLLTINMGNTRTKALLYQGEEKNGHYVIPTGKERRLYEDFLQSMPRPSRILLSSVVPAAAAELIAAADLVWGLPVEAISAREDLGLSFATVDYHQLGSDLFVNAVASQSFYGGNLLNVDLGSASTFCVIKDGVYLGTSIVPGMELSIRAMIAGTALLEDFVLQKIEGVIQDNTVACLQSGIYYGYFELVSGMIRRIQEEQGPLTVVLTGGIGTFLYDELAPFVQHFRPDLTLEGLKLIADLLPSGGARERSTTAS
jgi:type III pantothenate kinase